MIQIQLSTRKIFIALTAAPLAILGSGLILGELAHLKVCYLCNFQRFLYMVIAFFALWGVFFPRIARLWGGLVALTALSGAAAAIYQSWMQYAPQLATECGFGDPTLVERIVDWLGVRWPSMFMVTGFCTDKDWVFMGFSLANWSALIFLSFFAAVAGLLFLRHPWRN